MQAQQNRFRLKFWLISVLCCLSQKELNKQNNLLEQLLDTVIPHWANDLKDNANANADTIVERLNEEIRISECIKQNTRKRGL